MAAQLTSTKSSSPMVLFSWMVLAKTSLPVPVSLQIRTEISRSRHTGVIQVEDFLYSWVDTNDATEVRHFSQGINVAFGAQGELIVEKMPRRVLSKIIRPSAFVNRER